VSWTDAFLAAMESGATSRRYLLRSVNCYAEPGYYAAVCSHAGMEGVRGIRQVSTQSQRLQAATWQSSIGGFDVEVVGVDAIRHVMEHWARGTVLELLCYMEHLPEEDGARIGLGMMTGYTLRGGVLTVTCADLVTATGARLDRDSTDNYLFSSVSGGRQLTSGYTAGDATLTFSTTAGFQRETGGTGLVMVQPASGDPFFLTYTGKTGTTLTGASATGQLGTTAANAAIGDWVYFVAYLSGHPCDIVRKLLTSREQSNGAYDVYPAEWGLGFSADLVDFDDAQQTQTIVAATSGNYAWDYPQIGPVTDGYSWLADFLGRGGLFLAMRRGRVTVRAGVDPYASTAVIEAALHYRDLEDHPEVTGFDQDHAVEANVIRVLSGSGLTDGTAYDTATLPATRRRDYDLSDRLWTNESASRAGDIARLGPLATRVPERLVAPCAGLRAAAWTVGGGLQVADERIVTRALLTRGTVDRRGIIDEVSVDWSAGRVSVGVLLYPPDEEIGS
jgi:hypothetical protein